jgi:signal transduction histidine kinase
MPPDRSQLWHRAQQLVQAAIRITSEHDVDRVLKEVTDAGREVVDARYAALGIVNAERTGLERFASSGIPEHIRTEIGRLPEGRGVLGLLVTDPRPLRVDDIRSHPASVGFPPHHPPMRSFLGVPIIGHEGPIGNLYFGDKIGAESFTDEDEAYAVMLAAHASVAVENARYHADREQLLSELRRLHESRERFFAMTNHELRNALTAVHGWTELWIRKTAPDTPRAALEVEECAQNALTLLEDLLDISRIDADKLAPVVTECDAWIVVRESVATVEPAAERRGIAIDLSGPDGAVPCRSDAARIRQILINLLTNAVRHSPPGQPIVVELRVVDDGIRFDVVDRGEGIAQEQQASIFEAFERGGKQTERGTGLGLALSRQLSRLLGGDLRVESRVGHGARFTLQLPRFLTPPS